MPKKSEEYLFHLIKSLTKGERKCFNLFANYYSGREKKYLKVFEIIDRQKQFDEKKIKTLLQKNKIKTPLPKLKKYILELILKSLYFHHAGKSIDGQLQLFFAYGDICQHKGLTSLGDKFFGKARLIASRHEKHEATLTALAKRTINTATSTADTFEDYRQMLQKVAEQNEFRNLIFKIQQLIRKGNIRDEYLKTEWGKVINNSIMNRDAPPAGFEESCNYYRILAAYNGLMGNRELAVHYQKLIIEKLESHPEILKDVLTKYISELNNLIVTQSKIKDVEKTKDTMNKLLKMQDWVLNDKERSHLNNIIVLGYGNIIPDYLFTDNTADLIALISQAELFVQTKKSDSLYKSLLFNNLAFAHLYSRNYTKALFWNNMLLNESMKIYHMDIHTAGRILNLILHYELGNVDLVPYITRSVYRFLYKRKRLYKTEDAVLGFIRNKMPKANSHNQLIDSFKEFKYELEEILKDPYEAKALELFDFISWLESKIEKRPFAEILKEKAI